MLRVLQRTLSSDHLELLESEREKQETGAIYVMGNFIFHEYYYDGQSCVDELGGTCNTHNTWYVRNM
jgi:phenolic acid decarboxylase